MNTIFLEKQLRNKKLTLYQLSKITRLNESNLGKIINKKTKNPSIDYVLKIAKALDLTNDEFAELCGYRKDDENEKTI